MVSTPTNVRYHTDMVGGSGWLYEIAGRTILEHTCRGAWGGCDITDSIKVGGPAAVNQTSQAAMRHLSRRPHLGPIAPALSGPDLCHAGGGAVPYLKGPAR